MRSVELLEIAEIDDLSEKGSPLLESNMDIIKGVKVKLEVRVGEAELTVDELMGLSKDSIVSLTRSTTSPIDMLLDGKVVARGSLVAADDNFGIQITELNT